MLSTLLALVLGQSVSDAVDLDRLTRPAEDRLIQFSSFDRRSAATTRRAADGTDDDWFANEDRGQYLRQEDGAFVLAEADGPGTIVRIWSANPSGTLTLELDGTVVLREDMRALLSGEVDAFPSPFAEDTSRGCTLYYPLPFARHMKLSASAGDLYYQVGVRLGGDVTTAWSRETMPALPELVAEATGEETGSTILEGTGVVRNLEIDLPSDPKVLRETLLQILVDDEMTVLCPVGDFFGTAPGRTPFETLALAITPEGTGICRFPMPFARRLEVRVDLPVRMRFTRESRPLRFHAWWRGTNELRTRPRSDWPVLDVRGRGRFVGCLLNARNPVRAWWGEGDEKVFVDGEAFPSTFGTGTEDYFGYAWCDPTPFAAPYHAQTRCDGPGNKGHTSLLRLHVLDDIPFREALRFDMEVWHWVDCTMGLSTVAYWYAEPGSTHDFDPPHARDLMVQDVPPPAGVEGALEGEELRVVSVTRGIAEPQDLGFTTGFSRDAHLWWRDAGEGDVLRVAFDAGDAGAAGNAGARRLTLGLTRAPDYGIVRLTLNDELLADSVDLYDERVSPRPPQSFDDVALRPGENVLEITIVGSNPKAHPRHHMFGLDYVLVGP